MGATSCTSVRIAAELRLFHCAGQFVNPRHRLVEAERFDIAGDRLNGLVHMSIKRLIGALNTCIERTEQAP